MSGAALAVKERVTGWLGRTSAESASPTRLRLTGGPDRLFCSMVLILTALGIVMVFSAGAAFAAKKYGDWTYFLKREALYAGAGLLAFGFALRTDYGRYRRLAYPLLAVSVGLLGTLLIVGTRVNGAIRWFRIGPLSFQPSELAKLALALYLSLLLARNAEKVKGFSMGFLPPLLMTGVVVGLVVVQPDLGTSVILGLMALAMLFVSGARTSYLFLAVLVTAPVVWKVLITGKAWRMKRLLAFLDPWQYCQTAGYQLCESLMSVGSGGPWGQGLGQSRQKLFFLPEAHTDFILAIVGEELGLIGVLAVITAFGLLVWRGVLASMRARDAFGRYLAFGLTTLFGVQALGNMGVVLGLLPTKGLALPFISYGGTSLVVSLFMAGVLGNISARNPEPRPSPLFSGWQRRRAAIKNRRTARGPVIIVELPTRTPVATPAMVAAVAAMNAADETLRSASAALESGPHAEESDDPSQAKPKPATKPTTKKATKAARSRLVAAGGRGARVGGDEVEPEEADPDLEEDEDDEDEDEDEADGDLAEENDPDALEEDEDEEDEDEDDLDEEEDEDEDEDEDDESDEEDEDEDDEDEDEDEEPEEDSPSDDEPKPSKRAPAKPAPAKPAPKASPKGKAGTRK